MCERAGKTLARQPAVATRCPTTAGGAALKLLLLVLGSDITRHRAQPLRSVRRCLVDFELFLAGDALTPPSCNASVIARHAPDQYVSDKLSDARAFC